MGYRLRYFIAEDGGTLTRVPLAVYHRWFSEGEALPSHRAGRELRLLEVVLDVDRRRVVDVLRILPVRQHVRKDGRLDVRAAMQAALKRIALPGYLGTRGPDALIEELQADANYFWWPTDVQLEALGSALLGRSLSRTELADLWAVVVRPGASSRDG